MTLVGPFRVPKFQGKLSLQNKERQPRQSPLWRDTDEICLSGVETAGAINWEEHLNKSSDELLEN